MWNGERSLLLSKICVIVFGAALLGILVFSPKVIAWLSTYFQNPQDFSAPLFYITFFVGGAVAFFLLYTLFRLLHNIGNNQVFTALNVAYMRRISWSCFLGAFIAFVSGFYWLPWMAVAVAAGFVGLVVRVVKNVVAQAIRLKEENDYTI